MLHEYKRRELYTVFQLGHLKITDHLSDLGKGKGKGKVVPVLN
jgi:hypothetical protein